MVSEERGQGSSLQETGGGVGSGQAFPGDIKGSLQEAGLSQVQPGWPSQTEEASIVVRGKCLLQDLVRVTPQSRDQAPGRGLHNAAAETSGQSELGVMT